METTEVRSKSSNPLPWILMGAVLAPITILLLSRFGSAPELRNSILLVSVPLLGALAGWVVYALNPLGRPRGWRKSFLLVVAVLVYIMAVLSGFAIAQVATF